MLRLLHVVTRIVLGLGLPLVAWGCTGQSNSRAIEIRYLAWGNPEQNQIEQVFCSEFNRLNPDVHVTLTMVPGSAYKQKVVLMLASHTAPDVIRIDHYDFPSLVGKGYFFDLTGLAAKDPKFHREDFFPSTIREGTYKNHLYGLNVMFGGLVIYYNKTLFQRAGLTDPYQLSNQGRWNYEEFRKAAMALTERDTQGRPLQYGVQIPSFPLNAPFIWGFGGDLMDSSQSRCLLDSPEAIKGLQFLANLRWKDGCCPTPAQSANSAFNFESGKLGMDFNWMGMSPRYRKVVKDFQWDICPMPTGPKGSATVIKGNQLVVYSESAHSSEAWRFVRFMTSPGTEMKIYGKMRRNFPTRIAVAKSREYLDPTLEPHNTRVFLTSALNSKELPITDRWSEWTTAFNAQLDDLFSGRELDAAPVARRATRAANEVLADQEGF